MKRLLVRVLKPLLYGAYLILISSFLFFSMLEVAPGLTRYMNLQPIRYYAQWQEYRPDDTLVFVPTRAYQGHPTTVQTEFAGDLFSSEFEVPSQAVRYHATYTADGFRSNSSDSDFQVLVIGDSYVEIGENDSVTLSELLKETSKLPTFNLGRAWYGPFQYLELLKRYGSRIRPRYVVLCFFDGNDAEDTRQYLRWQAGKSYYTFVLSTKSYIGRYFTAFRDTYNFLLRVVAVKVKSIVSNISFVSRPDSIGKTDASIDSKSTGLHPDLGVIQVGTQPVPMRFAYWNPLKPAEDLLRTDEWKAIGQFLKDYERLATQHGIQPVVVFVPTKMEVYGSQYLENNNKQFVEKIKKQLQFENNSHDAFLHLMQDTRLRLVDLLPEFRQQARAGKLLYYPFDTHWNIEGRRIAAKAIGDSLVGSQAISPNIP